MGKLRGRCRRVRAEYRATEEEPRMNHGERDETKSEGATAGADAGAGEEGAYGAKFAEGGASRAGGSAGGDGAAECAPENSGDEAKGRATGEGDGGEKACNAAANCREASEEDGANDGEAGVSFAGEGRSGSGLVGFGATRQDWAVHHEETRRGTSGFAFGCSERRTRYGLVVFVFWVELKRSGENENDLRGARRELSRRCRWRARAR